MRLLWLPEVLRAAGLIVHEYAGWRERGVDSFGPVRGVICHGTGGSLRSTDSGELRSIAITGTPSAPAVPIAQLYLSRSGAVWVVASGTATGVKTGTAGPLKGLSDDSVIQIEAQHATGEPWTATQYNAYVRLCAALCKVRYPNYDVPVSRVAGHYEHQPRDKSDPWFDMNHFRAAVQRATKENEMIDETDFNALIWRIQALFGNLDATVGGPLKGEVNELKKALVGSFQELRDHAAVIEQRLLALETRVEQLPQVSLTDEQLQALAGQTSTEVASKLGDLRFVPKV